MRRLPFATLLAALVLTGCFTGERPTLVDPPPGGFSGTSSGDANADAVLEPLEANPTIGYTASFDLFQKFGGASTLATVTEDGGGRRSVTIGEVRFLDVGDQQTCNTATLTCEAGLLDARTSDTGFTSSFHRITPAQRLRLAVERKSGATMPSTEVIAGLPATCVAVPVGDGVESYCALAAGGLARWDAADLAATLISYEGVTSEALFTPG